MIAKSLAAFKKCIAAVPFVENSDAPGFATTLDAHCNQLATLQQELLQQLEDCSLSKCKEFILKRKHDAVQRCCQILLSQLSEPKKHQGDLKTITLASEKVLLAILDSQIAHYSCYFNFHWQAPYAYQNRCVSQMKTQQLLLIACFKRKNLNAELQDVLFALFNYDAVAPNYTFGQLNYLIKLQQLLVDYGKNLDQEGFDEQIIACLIYHNLNYAPFVKYLQTVMENQLLAIFNQNDQYAYWCSREKHVATLQERIGYVFDPLQDSAKQQWLAYITAGIVYHHRLLLAPESINSSGRQLAITPYRVKLNIAADGLAYLLRLMIEAGALEAEPRSKLLQFVANHFQTAGIGNQLLSANSLGTKYKQVVQRTAVNMRSLLKRMTKIIEANFEC